MNITPRMVVLFCIAAATLLILSLAVVGARFAAEQAVALRDSNSSTSTPTPTPTVDKGLATDEEILSVFSSRFASTRLLDGGTEPILFVTVSTDDAPEIATLINEAIAEMEALGDFSELTLLLEYNGKTLNAEDVSVLVDNSSAIENQLLIDLD